MNRRVVPIVIGGVTAIMAIIEPERMLALWPAVVDADRRLMQAWGLSTLGLVLAVAGVSPSAATQAVCIASIAWDLSWGGVLGNVAAALNVACAVSLD